MKSLKFYKGPNITDAESVRFLSQPSTIDKVLDEIDNNNNQQKSIWHQIAAVLKKFQSPQAKKAFFISFSLLLCSGGCWIFPGKKFKIYDEKKTKYSLNSSLCFCSLRDGYI